MSSNSVEKTTPNPITKLFNLNEDLYRKKLKNDKPILDPFVPCVITFITSIKIFLVTFLQIISSQVEHHEPLRNFMVFFFQFLFQYTKSVFFMSSISLISPENKILINNSIINMKESLTEALTSLTPTIYSINKDFIDKQTSSIQNQLREFTNHDDDHDDDDDDHDDDTQEL